MSNKNVCYVCMVPNRKPSKYRVLNAGYAPSSQRLEGPFKTFASAYERVKIYRGLELLGIDELLKAKK